VLRASGFALCQPGANGTYHDHDPTNSIWTKAGGPFCIDNAGSSWCLRRAEGFHPSAVKSMEAQLTTDVLSTCRRHHQH
jgi:hypothetical protein